MGKGLCERPFALHRLKPEKYKQNVDVVPPWKNFCGRQCKGHLGPAVRNTTEWSFSKSRLIKTFHRSTMTDERLTNQEMVSIEIETAKTLDMTELTKTFAFLKTWKKSFS